MKKILYFLTVLTIAMPLPTSLISCKTFNDNFVGEKYSDGVLYKNHKSDKVNDDRNGRGKLLWSLLDPHDTFRIRKQQGISINQISQLDEQFVKNCENNMLYKASDSSINAFHQLATTTEYYKDIADLSTKIRPANSPYQLDFQGLIDGAINSIGFKLTSDEKTTFSNKIIEFFTIITQLYGQQVINKLLYELENGVIMSNPNIIAATGFALWHKGGIQGMMLGPYSASESVSNQQYNMGFWSNKSIAGTLVHEMGHTISQYAGLAPQSRAYLNNFGPDIIGSKIVPHIKDIMFHNPSSGNKILFYKLRPGDALVRFLGRRVNIADAYTFQQRLAAWSFIQSGYGRSGAQDSGGNEELFAEGFSQWILTPDDQKGLNWEVLNEFYSSELIKLYGM